MTIHLNEGLDPPVLTGEVGRLLEYPQEAVVYPHLSLPFFRWLGEDEA